MASEKVIGELPHVVREIVIAIRVPHHQAIRLAVKPIHLASLVGYAIHAVPPEIVVAPNL